jgi:hypothetical protein
VLRKVDPSTPRSASQVTAPFARLLKRRLRAAGFATSDRVFGLHWTGRMTRERLGGLIEHLPEGISEIYLHPATGAYAGSAPGYRYREELQALVSPEILRACRDGAVRLGGFADFCDSRSPAGDSVPAAGAASRTMRRQASLP